MSPDRRDPHCLAATTQRRRLLPASVAYVLAPNRHATAHFHATSHPIMRSAEPGEHWSWCYVDQIGFEVG